jgi:delta-aminolevulinic acid dehydratase/porphobilinogen synthase
VEDALKDKEASYSWRSRQFLPQNHSKLKSTFPEACLMSDVAMDPYSSDGHDGFVDQMEKLSMILRYLFWVKWLWLKQKRVLIFSGQVI